MTEVKNLPKKCLNETFMLNSYILLCKVVRNLFLKLKILTTIKYRNVKVKAAQPEIFTHL